MAALAYPHWEALPKAVRLVLERLGRVVNLEPFYLAGGTALALRLGHRVSVDLDFFGAVETFSESWQHHLVSQLGDGFQVTDVNFSPFGLSAKVNQVELGLLTYGYPLLDSLEEVAEIKLAGLTDIGLMKLDAIASRGTRKDFYDVFFITRHISLDDLFEKASAKFSYAPRFATNVLTAFVDFDVAETFPEPTLLTPTSWSEVKEFFVVEAQRLGHSWLDP